MDLLLIPRCPLCKSENATQTARAGSISLYSCPACGLVFKPTEELDRTRVQQIQDEVYQDLRLRTEVRMLYRMAEDRLNNLKPYKQSGSLLEVGCATGEFLESASSRGFKTTGIDASKLYADYARSKGLNVRNGLLEEVLAEDETFDAIAMFHLIEHIPDPVPFLETVKAHLKDDGILFIVCPNLHSRSRKIFGYWHSNYQQPDHLAFFSERTLTDLVQRAGFSVESSFSREYPHSFFTSLRGYLTIRIGSWKRERKKIASNGDPTKPQAAPTREKSLYKYLYKQIPYWLGTLLSPVLKPLGARMEKRMEGHELCLIAKKNRYP